MAKLIEKVLKESIVNFIERNNILSVNQYGFRSGNSTEDAIRRLTEEKYSWLDCSKVGLCVFIDLVKAFDAISHQTLLDGLYINGFRGRSYELIKRHLRNKTQSVEIADHRSKQTPINYGVPKGRF